MNEVELAYKIRQHLNGGLRELRSDTSQRLAAARQKALACQKSTVNQSILVTAGGFFLHSFDNFGTKQVLVALALVACLVSSTVWVADRRINELGAIDTALLSNDLPIAAFTDKGFDRWLTSASSQ